MEQSPANIGGDGFTMIKQSSTSGSDDGETASGAYDVDGSLYFCTKIVTRWRSKARVHIIGQAGKGIVS